MTYKIGDQVFGGIVFALDKNREHGIVVANTDQGEADWNNAFQLVKNPSNYDSAGNRFIDWYLPSQGELSLMFWNLYKAGLGDFSEINFYWSSTEDNSTPSPNAMSQRFTPDGRMGLDNKINTRIVRAVRAF